jgi:hypothetical protein
MLSAIRTSSKLVNAGWSKKLAVGNVCVRPLHSTPLRFQIPEQDAAMGSKESATNSKYFELQL